MKTLTKILAVVLLSLVPVIVTGQEKDKKVQSVKFVTSIDCDECVNTVMNNLPKEKGVKDVRCDLPAKEIAIKYDGKKTDPDKLRRSIEKLGYTAKVISNPEPDQDRK